MSANPHPGPNVTRSLHRAVGLLRLLASHTRIGWRLSDLAEQSELDPGTVHRLLSSLCEDGLVTRVPGSRHYTLGALAFELGLAAAPYFDLGRLARPQLAAAAEQLRGTLFLKMRSGKESVCLARHDGVGRVPSLMLDVGGRRPLCLTAGGVAMLIQLPPAEQQQIETHNRRTVIRREAGLWQGVRQMLARSRPRGIALNLGDIAAGITAIGVPIRSDDGTAIASLTLALAGAPWLEARAEAMAQRLHAVARDIAPHLAQLRW